MKKIYIVGGIITVILIGLLFSTDYLVSSFIEKKVAELLEANKSEYYSDTIGDIEFKFRTKSLTFSDVTLVPTAESIANLANKTSHEGTLDDITLSSIRLEGIDIWGIIYHKEINIESLVLNDLIIHKLENSDISIEKATKEVYKAEAKKFSFDSLHVAKINGIQIAHIGLNNFQYQVFDYAKNKITFKSDSLSFVSNGIKLEKYGEDLFRLKALDNIIELENIQLSFFNAAFDFSIEKISYDFENDIIDFQQLNYKPYKNKIELANSYLFTKAIFDAELENLRIYNFDILKAVSNQGFFIDSLHVTGLDLELYKDNTKPFDESRYQKNPHVALKEMQLPIYIGKVLVDSSYFIIENKMEYGGFILNVSFHAIDAEITNITSIDSLREEPIIFDLKSRFMDSAPLTAKLVFPLKDNQNTFYFSAEVGSSRLTHFDDAIYPALGLKILEGELDKLTFSASANNVSSTGKMTMLYHDLRAEVFKNESSDKSKFLTWMVNGVVRSSNPGNNGNIREVDLNFDRVFYKGIGDYIWKTIQSGVIRTIAPGGSKTKESKAIIKQEKADKKEARRNERQKKKDARNASKNAE